MPTAVFGLLFVVAAAAPSVAPAASASTAPTATAAPLTLDAAVRAALAQRPELAAVQARIEARREAAAAAWGPFFPRLTLNALGHQARTPIAGPFSSYFQRDTTLSSQGLSLGVGLVEDLPTGTHLELRTDGGVSAYTFYAEALSPRWEPALKVKLSQELWRGLSPDVNLAPVAIAEAELGLEEAALVARAQAIALEVAEAWLDASRAAALVSQREASVGLAKQFETLTRQLIDGGSASRLDLALAVQTVAQRNADLAAAHADRDLTAARLGELLGAAVPVDGALPLAAPLPPVASPVPDLGAVLVEATQASPQLQAARAALQRVRAAAPLAGEAWSPSVRLVIDGSVAGLAGTTTCTNGYLSDGLSPCHVPEEYRGGIDRAYGNLASGQLYAVGVGLEGELPTFWGPGAAAERSSAADLAAAEAELRAAEQRIAWQARRLARDVEQRRTLLDAATANLTFATEALTAEETKMRGGRSTGFALLRAQELRVDAELQQTHARYQLAAATARVLTLMGRMTARDVAAPAPAASAADGQR